MQRKSLQRWWFGYQILSLVSMWEPMISSILISNIYRNLKVSLQKLSCAWFFRPASWGLDINEMLCVTFNMSMLLLFQFINSAFSDYNKDQFTPVKLEGTDEQVSRGHHKVLLFFQCCCLRKFFQSPFGSKKKKVRSPSHISRSPLIDKLK